MSENDSLFTIIIPCHDDCEKAKKLANSLDNVIVGHNGCKNEKSFPWSNKAKTINHLAKNINSEYVVVLDADVNFSISIILILNLYYQVSFKFLI